MRLGLLLVQNAGFLDGKRGDTVALYDKKAVIYMRAELGR